VVPLDEFMDSAEIDQLTAHIELYIITTSGATAT
jgi:hypothetical protein